MDCKVYGCVRKEFHAGLCHRHYEEERAANAPPCKIEGCDEKATRAGMCNRHYRQQKLAVAPPCTVDGCGRPQFVGGLCSTHHKRVQRHGSLGADQRAHDRGARRKHPLYESWRFHHRVQNLALAWEDFWSMVRDVGDRPSHRHILKRLDQTQKIGPGNWQWFETIPTPGTAAEYQREYRKRRPERVRNTYLKMRYGITLDDYNSMLEKQDGVCAICKKPDSAKGNHGTARELAVDHCHDTGRVRGLLCTGCNTAIGKLRTTDNTMKNARRYLSRK